MCFDVDHPLVVCLSHVFIISGCVLSAELFQIKCCLPPGIQPEGNCSTFGKQVFKSNEFTVLDLLHVLKLDFSR